MHEVAYNLSVEIVLLKNASLVSIALFWCSTGATPLQITLSAHDCSAAGSILPLVGWTEDLSSQCTVCSSSHNKRIFWTSQHYCGRQQENHLMGAAERNSWKLNAMCPHEFLRALSSYCASNVQDSKQKCWCISQAEGTPAKQSIITCQPHHKQHHTVTPGDTNIQ